MKRDVPVKQPSMYQKKMQGCTCENEGACLDKGYKPMAMPKVKGKK